jgi:hypothetical protein
MTRTDDEFNDYGKRTLAPLHPAPSIDPQMAAEAKKQFLIQAENLQQDLISPHKGLNKEQMPRKANLFHVLQHKPLMKALVVVLLTVLVILSGSSITVYAAQSSFPGEPLYTIKSWSEDARLYMTFSTKAKLYLTLDYTNRRVDEISGLSAGGIALNDQTSDRFQRELDNALQLAAQLDDTQIQNALGLIKSHAENQGMTMEELINTLPPQAEPAMLQLQARLTEQVKLSKFGEADPQAFRAQIRERLQKQKGPNHSPDTDRPEAINPDAMVTQIPGQNGNDKGNKIHQTPDVPGHDNPGNGNGQSTPGTGNHGPNESQTPEP